MQLAKVLQPGSRYRLTVHAVGGAAHVELELVKESHRKSPGARVRKSATDRGFLPGSRYFEADDEAELLTFWHEGKGVSIEMGGWVPYTALISIEPVD
jgi:hypothetical protein